MATYKYVIIGGGIAGGRACEGIRQIDEDGSILLVTREQHPPYERPPLSKSYLRDESGLARVYLRGSDFYDEKNVEILKGLDALHINPAQHQVLCDGGVVLDYKKLLLATGGRAIELDIPGKDLENVFTLRTIEDSEAIREAGGNDKKALVLGGSFIGSEAAASLAQMGTEVIQIFPEARILERIVPEEVSDHITALYQRHGVRIQPGTVTKSLEGDEYIQKAVLDNGERLDIDLMVMGVGIQLNTELAVESGLRVREEDNAIVVDEYLRTSDPDIYAAGDVAAWPDPTFNQRLRVEHWDVARRQGRQAGRNMAGEKESYTALPYFFSDLFDLSFEVWGNLSKWDQTVTRGTMESGSFAVYYFEEDRLNGVLSVNRPDEERKPMQSLVKARCAFREIAENLQDENASLAEMAGEKPEIKIQEDASAGLSFAEDIAPLFRDSDVEEMKDISDFDLSDYEDVRNRAERIHERLLDESMPCDEPWPEEKIDKFKRWMDEGMQP
jgi:NADPH-dependent 2,4-dienoyl-CoA reductase/sulfur reductase-like enzyme